MASPTPASVSAPQVLNITFIANPPTSMSSLMPINDLNASGIEVYTERSISRYADIPKSINKATDTAAIAHASQRSLAVLTNTFASVTTAPPLPHPRGSRSGRSLPDPPR